MVNEKDIKMAAHSIYFKNADMPKETVIARGKVIEDEIAGIHVGNKNILYLDDELAEYDGKTIEIIIREVSDE